MDVEGDVGELEEDWEGGEGKAAMMVCSSNGYKSRNETFFFLRSEEPVTVPVELVLRMELRLEFRLCEWMGVSFSLGELEIELEREEQAEDCENMLSTDERMLAGVRREEVESCRLCVQERILGSALKEA